MVSQMLRESLRSDLMLLHPQQDDLSAHIGSLSDGRLIGLTKCGWFHIVDT